MAYASHYILNKIFYSRQREGFDTQTKVQLGANARKFADEIKLEAKTKHDRFLFSTYHGDYEKAIVNMADLVEMIMMETLLSINPKDPMKGIDKLAKLGQSKAALNILLKDLDRK